MVWTSWQQFFAMGGHGVYVWWSFGLTLLVILLELGLLGRARKAVLAAIVRKQQLVALQAEGNKP